MTARDVSLSTSWAVIDRPYSCAAERLFAQTKREEGVAGSNRHVLLSFDFEGHRTGGDLASKARIPEKRAGTRIERVEVSFTSAGEEQIGGGRENSAVGDVGHQESPLLVARAR